MRDQVDRYFELLPVLLIALVMLVSEFREPARPQLAPSQPTVWQEIIPERTTTVAPRLLFR